MYQYFAPPFFKHLCLVLEGLLQLYPHSGELHQLIDKELTEFDKHDTGAPPKVWKRFKLHQATTTRLKTSSFCPEEYLAFGDYLKDPSSEEEKKLLENFPEDTKNLDKVFFTDAENMYIHFLDIKLFHQAYENFLKKTNLVDKKYFRNEISDDPYKETFKIKTPISANVETQGDCYSKERPLKVFITRE